MLTDPLVVTYNSVAKTLPRVSLGKSGASYKTADGEFEIYISKTPPQTATWEDRVYFEMARILPDPTPSDVFDAFRRVRNTFGITYCTDTSRGSTSVDVPLLRSAVLAFVDTTLQGRLIGGER